MIIPNNDILFQFMYMICLHYKPSKSNKHKIKQLFEDFPFFIHDKVLLFDIIVSNPITLFYHQSNITQYSYLIYKSYHLKLNKNYLSYPNYIEHYNYLLYYDESIQQKEHKKRAIKVVLFIIICVYFICISRIGWLS